MLQPRFLTKSALKRKFFFVAVLIYVAHLLAGCFLLSKSSFSFIRFYEERVQTIRYFV